MSEFEAIRQANIKANQELLISLGLDTPLVPSKSKPKAKNASVKAKKRKASASAEEEVQRPAKSIKSASAADSDATPMRRSTRSAATQRINYNESVAYESTTSSKVSMAKSRGPRLVSSAAITASEREHEGNRLGKRLHNPKTFGAIPGVEVGTWWETRAACSTDAIHAPFVAGIAGSAIDGAYSVALSGGYDDDVDLGYAFTYTGSGGRDLKGTKANPKNLRTAPQSCDQTFDNPMNAALKKSSETKKPVRVIRGFKLNSPYAPDSGYRYDGLYTVERAWLERGLNKNGYKVCKYAFKRLDGQLPLPAESAEGDEDTRDLQSEDENSGKESTNEEESKDDE
ncbi:PUA-like domain-containing protein [Gautieria morchelliformis]|nr:PUA-like domain-containing protein [Gautieria morchelliformis]